MATLAKPTTTRFDEDIKVQAVSILDSIGLSFNAYLNLAVRQLVNQRQIPFDLKPATSVPNEQTRIAMITAEAKELGIIPDDSPRFSNADDAMTFLDAE